MSERTVQRATGWSGVLVGVGTLSSVPLYFVYSGPPPASNVLTRSLLTLIVIALLLVFFTGLTHMLRRARPDAEWLGSLMHGAVLIFLGITLITIANETGVVFLTPDGSVDPTTDGPLAAANVLMHGSIKRLLTVLILIPAGYAILRTHVLPRWAGWSACVIGLCNLAFVPALYFGTDVTKFYSAHGWGNSALTGSLIGYWVFAVGIAALRQRPQTRSSSYSDAESGFESGAAAQRSTRT
jgi:hypothetical protein